MLLEQLIVFCQNRLTFLRLWDALDTCTTRVYLTDDLNASVDDSAKRGG